MLLPRSFLDGKALIVAQWIEIPNGQLVNLDELVSIELTSPWPDNCFVEGHGANGRFYALSESYATVEEAAVALRGTKETLGMT